MSNQFSRKPIEWFENENGCYICTSHSKDQAGYIRIRLNGQLDRVHRMIYRECFGEIPSGMVVMHKCDNPSCINIEHLTLGTQKNNMQDCLKKHRKHSLKGSNNGRAKLTECQVKAILKDTRSQNKIAKEYGVTQAQISAIKLAKTWNSIKEVK